MQWFYVVSGQRVGPVAQSEFDHLVASGVITAETLVWRDGMAAWQPYAAVAPAGAVPPSLRAAVPVGTGMTMARGPGSASGNLVYAHFGRRLVAKILDVIILGVATSALNVVVALVLYGGMGASLTSGESIPLPLIFLFQGLSIVASVVIGLTYCVYFTRRYNATLGKMVMGLKLVRPDGSSLSIGRIIGRYFAEWLSGMILMVGYLLAAFDQEHRALHDMICDTRVIKSP